MTVDDNRTARTGLIRVAVAGAQGKMGSEAVRALQADGRFHLAAVLVRDAVQQPAEVPAYTDVQTLLDERHPDVWLDLTDAQSVVSNIDHVVERGVRPVIGSTGYTATDRDHWDKQLRAQSLGGLAVPNFAIGALLMMRFAQEAARLFDKVEIIEMHHDGKKDAPSGTAKRTAEAVATARGGQAADIPIHSVRLPGLVAHQEVLFGGTGELLTIRHDSLARTSFMPGVLLACAEVHKLQGLIYGLDHLLW